MLNLLPDELILHVLRFLTPKENTVLSATNRRMRELCNDRSIWQYYLEREHFPFRVENPKAVYINHNSSFRCKFIKIPLNSDFEVVTILDHSHVVCKNKSTVVIENFRTKEFQSFPASVVSNIVDKHLAYFNGDEVCIYNLTNNHSEVISRTQNVIRLCLSPSFIGICKRDSYVLAHRVRADISRNLSDYPAKLIEKNNRLLVTYKSPMVNKVDVFSTVNLLPLIHKRVEHKRFVNLVGNYLVTSTGSYSENTYEFYSFLARSSETQVLDHPTIGVYKDRMICMDNENHQLISYFPGEPLQMYALGNLECIGKLKHSMVHLEDSNKIRYTYDLKNRAIYPISFLYGSRGDVLFSRFAIFDFRISVEDYLKRYQELTSKALEKVLRIQALTTQPTGTFQDIQRRGSEKSFLKYGLINELKDQLPPSILKILSPILDVMTPDLSQLIESLSKVRKKPYD